MESMKVVILPGSLETQLAEKADIQPKSMTEIGDRPILRPNMMHCAHDNITNFAIVSSSKGGVAREYMADAYTPTACKRDRFWQCVGTFHDKQLSGKLWDSDNAPQVVWERDHAYSGNRA